MNSDLDQLIEFYADRIAEINEEIKELYRKEKKQSIDGRELDDAIYKVVERKLTGFKFYLKRDVDFYLDFRIRGTDTLIISFNPTEKLTNDFILNKRSTRQLIGLEFKLNNDTSCIEYAYELKLFRNSIFIKVLISRFLFDVFSHVAFDNPAFIEYD